MDYNIDEHGKHLHLTIQGAYDETKVAQIISLALHRLCQKEQAHLLVDLRKVTGNMMTFHRLMIGYQCAGYYTTLLPFYEVTKVAIVESREVKVQFKDDAITEKLKFYNTKVLITRDYEEALEWIESE